MTVIINELEVVVEQPPPPGATAASAGGAASPPLQPPEIENIRERQTRMRLRLAAH